MPLMYAENTLQMEWCLDCHRNPAKNIRPSTEVYNMGWQKPSEEHPVWCAVVDEKSGTPTAQSVNCVTSDPNSKSGIEPVVHAAETSKPEFEKFDSQDDLGRFLVKHYKIRTPRELASCEVCHR
jgi:hypothetical protein